MGNKITTFLIILVLIAALGVVGYMIYSMITPQSTEEQPVQQEIIKPEIYLDKTAGEDNTMIITVLGTTTDSAGIKEIVLPDETTIESDSVEYNVTENGEYEFTVIAANGEKATSKIEVTEIAEISSKDPYVPKGFTVVSDSVEEGFIIEDGYGNQFVWVPVETGKMTRTTTFDTDYEENNTTASALVNSVAKYYGFYIARYEASEGEIDGVRVARSVRGEFPWVSLNCLDAIDYANNMGTVLGYEECYTALLSSSAWDTALSWIDTKYKDYSSNVEYGNYSGLINRTGTTSTDIVCQICDMAGNVREWTTEIYKKEKTDSESKNVISRVVRGGAANLSRTPKSRIGYAEDLVDQYWGFRVILYK